MTQYQTTSSSSKQASKADRLPLGRTSWQSQFSQKSLVVLQELPGVGHRLPDGVHRQEPLRPRRQARELGLVEEAGVGHLVHHLEPHHEAADHDVDEPDGVAAEERLPLGALHERSLQHLHLRKMPSITVLSK
uniref:Uncharacterized protein n=1 Tax=Oryza glumipatula TaxID=40148 RepID=A0A0D9YDH1_9ORYZ